MGFLSMCAQMRCEFSVLTILVMRVPFYFFICATVSFFQDSDSGDTYYRRKVRTGRWRVGLIVRRMTLFCWISNTCTVQNGTAMLDI